MRYSGFTMFRNSNRPSRRDQSEFTRNTARYVNKRFNVSNPFERVLILLVIAVVVGVMVGVVLPKISPEVGELTGEYAASGPAADVLETLRVDDDQSGDGYDRDLFGYRETDDDGDGCDVRDEVLARDLDNKTVVDMMNDALKDAGPIVYITAAGGALGAVVNASGAAGIIADWLVATGIPGIAVPLLIGTIMRFPQGSGTTAMITGSAIVGPMVATLGVNPYIAGLAICMTAMCPSYLNDSYFHVVTNFSGLDIKTSLKTWSIGSILVPIVGSIILIIASIFIH